MKKLHWIDAALAAFAFGMLVGALVMLVKGNYQASIAAGVLSLASSKMAGV